MREALFALSEVERELVPGTDQARLPDVLEQVMLDAPDHWRGYYEGDEAAQHLARRYSYSDRARYYWPDPRVEAATEQLMSNLRQRSVPLPPCCRPTCRCSTPGSAPAGCPPTPPPWSWTPCRTCSAATPRPAAPAPPRTPAEDLETR